jgi:rSAM/selenodomain-associated transferase 2
VTAGAGEGEGAARLSVVVPALDEADNLERLLPALRRWPEAQVVVVDGGSRDATPQVLARQAGVRWLIGPPGRARQMNAGARAAGGEVLLFLHADTRLPEGALEAIGAAMADPRVVGGRFDVAFDSRRPIMRATAALMNLRSRLSGIATGDQAIFVRRAVFEAMGGFPDIPLMEDVEFSRRLKRRGRLACLRLRVTTSARKWEREGPLRTVLLMWSLRLLYFLGAPPRRLHRWYYGRDPAP